MIKKLILINAQRFKRIEIDFDKGFNCITGGNLRGKSTIVRIIKWIFDNDPSGNWMMRKDRKKEKFYTTIAKMILEDGTVIKRVKGRGKNYYAVNSDEYNEVGRGGMPVEVIKAIGLNRLLMEMDINVYVHTDEDKPFLVMEKNNGIKASALNILTGADLLEKTIKEFNRLKMGLAVQRNTAKELIEETNTKLEWYARLDELPIERIAKLERIFNRLDAKIDKLDGLHKTYAYSQRVIDDYNRLSPMYKDVFNCKAMLDEYAELDRKIGTLDALQKRFEGLHVEEVPAIDFAEIDTLRDKFIRLSDKCETLDELYSAYMHHESEMKMHKKNKELYAKELDGMRCPTCRGIIKKENL